MARGVARAAWHAREGRERVVDGVQGLGIEWDDVTRWLVPSLDEGRGGKTNSDMFIEAG